MLVLFWPCCHTWVVVPVHCKTPKKHNTTFVSGLLTLWKRVCVLRLNQPLFSAHERDTIFISSLSPKQIDLGLSMQTIHRSVTVAPFNSRKLVLCHASLLKAAVYNYNQTTHLLLCCFIPDAVDVKKDWLRGTVVLLWVSRSSATFEESGKTQRSRILHVYGKCFKWIWPLLIFFIIPHLFLTWICLLLNGTLGFF